MMTFMSKLGLLTLIFCVFLPSGCRSRDRSKLCAPIGCASRVVVRLAHDTTSSNPVITDPSHVQALAALADARRERSQPSLYTMPAPEISAAFYDGDKFLGVIGEGPNFLFVSCGDWKGIREATPAEIETF